MSSNFLDERYKPLHHRSALASFLSRHDVGHGVFLSHLDGTPLNIRRRAFFQASTVHAFFSSICLWRLTRVYIDYGSPSKLYSSLSLSGILWICLELVIIYITGPPSLEFARGCFWYRLRHGFSPTEIIIRRPRTSQLKQFARMSTADASAAIHDQILRAMDVNLLQSTPGDITDLSFWQVDYRACEDAHKLARLAGPDLIEENAWKMSVWIRNGAETPARWTVFEDWKVHDPARQDRRQELLKEILDAMGKGKLYEEWRNMVYSNSMTPSGAGRYISMGLVSEHLAFFERKGIDFGPIGEQINRQINEEFESLDIPVGF